MRHRKSDEAQRLPRMAGMAAGLCLAAAIVSIVVVPKSAAGNIEQSAKQPAAVKLDKRFKGSLPITELTADQATLHALNRLGYGPRPGDVERIHQMGLAKWIDQQLNPNSIDDKALEARLENYPTLKMSSATLIAEYPQPKQAEKQAAKRAQAQV